MRRYLSVIVALSAMLVLLSVCVYCVSTYRLVSIADDDAREDMKAFEALKNVGATLGADTKGRINWVSLEGVPVSNATVEMVKRLRKIGYLDLSGTSVTDSQLTEITDALNVVELNVERTRVSDAVLPSLARKSSIRRLMLGGARISDTGIRRYLLTMSRLEHVSVSENISADILAEISKMPSMSEIEMVNATGERKLVVHSGRR